MNSATTYLEVAARLVTNAVLCEKSSQKLIAAGKYIEAVSVYIKTLEGNDLNDAEKQFVINNVALYAKRANELLTNDCPSERLHTNAYIDKQQSQVPCMANEDQSECTAKSGMDAEVPESLQSAVCISKPTVKWDDVIGLEEAKGPMQEAVLNPILFPGSPQASFAHKGLLLFGPGGAGKTQLCKALAAEANNATFITVRPDMLLSKWVGESEKLVRG
ncbi:unnamed protein product, partial [Allacma fusca]